MSSPSIRFATPADTQIVAGFVHALLDELSGGNPPALETMVDCAREVLASGCGATLLAYDGTAPVGVMCLSESMAIYAGGRFGVITELYVVPEKRSAGIARLLLDRALEEGRARGWKRLEVGAPSQPKWHRTLRFYLDNGFQEVGPRLRIFP